MDERARDTQVSSYLYLLANRVSPSFGHFRSDGKVRLLEVGALKHDNYGSCESWVACSPIDLRSRHPEIREQDFLKLDVGENKDRWDVVSLSLVVNFVPDAKDRGECLCFIWLLGSYFALHV
jgi:25S rRNA (adenine2142-N1)-methyltransferase